MIRDVGPTLVFGVPKRQKRIWGLPYGAELVQINATPKSFATATIRLVDGRVEKWSLSDYGWCFWRLKYKLGCLE